MDVRYPDAELIVLMLDNLNTHTPASLYDAFPPEEAKRLAAKLEIHYMPKYGSWLNCRHCRDRRAPDLPSLERAVAAWPAHRNTAGGAINSHFTTADARIKLTYLYPSLDESRITRLLRDRRDDLQALRAVLGSQEPLASAEEARSHRISLQEEHR